MVCPSYNSLFMIIITGHDAYEDVISEPSFLAGTPAFLSPLI